MYDEIPVQLIHIGIIGVRCRPVGIAEQHFASGLSHPGIKILQSQLFPVIERPLALSIEPRSGADRTVRRIEIHESVIPGNEILDL